MSLRLISGGAGDGILETGPSDVRAARRRKYHVESDVRREAWRMPPPDQLQPAALSRASRIWMIALRLYLVIAGGLVFARIIALAVGHN